MFARGEFMIKKSGILLVIMLLIGMVGVSATGAFNGVENAELEEVSVMQSDVAFQWDVVIQIDEVCLYCYVEFHFLQIVVDDTVVFYQDGGGDAIFQLNYGTWRIQEWQYSVGSGFDSVELVIDLEFYGIYGTQYGSGDSWHLDIGLVNDGFGINRIVELDAHTPIQWNANTLHAISWDGGDQEVDTDQDGFTEVGGTYSGPCLDRGSSGSGYCFVDMNGDDKFPDNPTQQTDRDGDGYGDNPNGSMGDAFPDNPQQWNDLDGDGYGDNLMYGAGGDQCPNVWGNSSFDRVGCLDNDGDGWSDEGVFGDDCPNVWGNSSHDRVGCLDSDGDHYSDEGDAFPSDPMEFRDSDGDGVGNYADQFPYFELEWYDSDGDGWGDNSDWAIYDRTEWSDSDGDGVGDNSDVYPNDLRRSSEGDMLEPGMGLFWIIVGLLVAVLFFIPSGSDSLNDYSLN
jgi:hypothetical protein